MSDDGFNSGFRNFGRLCLALIPWALGIGAAVWLGWYIALHQFRRELSQEKRAAVYVGAKNRPKGKMRFDIASDSCLEVIRIDLDGGDLIVYGKNECHMDVRYGIVWHWQSISPDGTVLHQGWQNGAFCPGAMRAGDKAECRMEVDVDDRAEVLRAWIER